jgi:hypothetical protein
MASVPLPASAEELDALRTIATPVASEAQEVLDALTQLQTEPETVTPTYILTGRFPALVSVGIGLHWLPGTMQRLAQEAIEIADHLDLAESAPILRRLSIRGNGTYAGETPEGGCASLEIRGLSVQLPYQSLDNPASVPLGDMPPFRPVCGDEDRLSLLAMTFRDLQDRARRLCVRIARRSMRLRDRVQVDLASGTVTVDGNAYTFTPTQAQIIKCLVEADGAPVSGPQMREAVGSEEVKVSRYVRQIHVRHPDFQEWITNNRPPGERRYSFRLRPLDE